MLRYTLIFLLVNSYGRSMGVPVRKENSNGTSIGNLLSNLSKQCKNEFVLGQIESKHNVCNVELSYYDVPMQCLMFYDANHALCNAPGVDAAELATDSTAKLSGAQNVTTFCSEAALFTLPTATAYPQMIHFVFQSEVACTKVCADEDIRTGHTNFFCKYYKWALSKLVAVPNSTQHTVKPAGSGVSSVTQEKIDATAVHLNQAADGQPKVDSDKDVLVPLGTQSVKNDGPSEHPSEVANQGASSAAQLTSIQTQDSSKLQIEADIKINKSTQAAQTQRRLEGEIASDLEGQPKPDREPIADGNSEAGNADNAGALQDIAVNQFETQGQKAHLDNDDDTGVDTEDEDTRDENLDAGDDGEDPIINMPGLRNDQVVKDTDKQIETQSMYGGGSQGENIQNPGGFTEDDDHFFPFFLSAVIIVVVLYVLYHNKNKVGKLIFGLIVEGRQPGRRRNSRGHAYRRLDTLEQAMSANTAAPPSKIIY